MKFTKREMDFLNAVTGGGHLFGLPKQTVAMDEKQKEELVRGLKDKGILESEEKLSVTGGRYVKAVKEYREAKRHLICNYLHASITAEGWAVLVEPLADGYEIKRVPAGILTCLILERCPEGMEEDVRQGAPERTGLAEVLQEIHGAGDAMMVGSFSGNKAMEESVYYVRGKTICCYDFGSGKRRAVGGRQMRKELADIVAGKGGGCMYVG